MSRTILRRISWPVVLAGLTAPFIANCGGGMPGLPGGGGLPGVSGNCPDIARYSRKPVITSRLISLVPSKMRLTRESR